MEGSHRRREEVPTDGGREVPTDGGREFPTDGGRRFYRRREGGSHRWREGGGSTDGGLQFPQNHGEWVVTSYQGCRVWFRCYSCEEADTEKREDPCAFLASGQVGMTRWDALGGMTHSWTGMVFLEPKPCGSLRSSCRLLAACKLSLQNLPTPPWLPKVPRSVFPAAILIGSGSTC